MKRTLLVGLGLLSPMIYASAEEVQAGIDSVRLRHLSEVEVLSNRRVMERKASPTLRLNQPILEIPQNILVINNRLLSERQINNVDEGLASLVSGVTRIEHWGSFSRFNARGSRLASFRDGMNITTNWGPMTEDMAFVERLEFVKGPAGFMMSNGEPSGLYNVVTKKATGERKGEVSLSYGSYQYFRGTLDLGGKISERLSYRLNVYGQSNQSHRKHEFAKRYGIAPVLNYQISEDTDLTLQYMYQHLTASNIGGPYVFSQNGFGSLPREASMLEPGLTPTYNNDHYALARLTHRLNERWTLTAQTAWSLSLKEGESMWLDQTNSRSAVNDWPTTFDAKGNVIRYISSSDARMDMRFGQAYFTGKEQTGAISHNILAGLDLGEKNAIYDWMQKHRLDTPAKPFNILTAKNNGVPANGYPKFDRTTPLETRSDATRISQSFYGIYIQDQLGFFNDALRLTLAGRYTDVKDDSYGTTVTHERHFSPRIGLSYSIDQATSVYALYDQAFSPQLGRTRTSDKLKPITGNTYELGFKKEWFGGRLMTSLSAFVMLRENETSVDPLNTSGEDYRIQDGQSKSQGIELDVMGEILPGLRLEGNYALTDYRVTKSSNPSRPVGMRMAGYAKHTINAWLYYRLPLNINLGLGYHAQLDRSSWGFAPAKTNQRELPDYGRWDARISWETNRMTIGLNVNNIADKLLYSGRAYADYTYMQIEAGRNVRLQMTYRF